MTENEDLVFKTEKGRLNYRVGAIIIHENKLLMVKNKSSKYFYTVGGRVKFSESSEEAVIRETKEETGINIDIDRLGFIHENFYSDDSTNIVYHEIALFYYMKNTDKLKHIKNNELNDDNDSFYWIPLIETNNVDLYPEFFKTKLLNCPDKVEHIISKRI